MAEMANISFDAPSAWTFLPSIGLAIESVQTMLGFAYEVASHVL
jgi:hypothetical protein